MNNKFIIALLFLWMPLAQADVAATTRDDPALEKRAMALSGHLRCLVCQNQTIADSNAELAVDLKNQVRDKLRQGQSEQEILDYMVNRYGEFVLFSPLVKSTTWLLWFGPLLLFVAGFYVLAVNLRQRRRLMQQAPILNKEEHARAAALLSGKETKGHP